MIERLKNLFELSKYHPTEKDGQTLLETDTKPIGMATIVDLEDKSDNLFEDDSSN